MLVPIPINLDTVNKLYGLNLTSDELEGWFAARAETVDEIRTSEDVVVSKVGRELYEKFFRGYTRKQWGLDPSELDKSVTARVPTRTNRDDRYFTDEFQFMPKHGYTRMFEKMLAHPNIHVMTQTDYRDVRDDIPHRRVIYTGPIDEYFGFRFGKLPYRSLRFEHQTLDKAWFQPVGTVNYPQTQDYTRISEYKHMTGQDHPRRRSPMSIRPPKAIPITRSHGPRTRSCTRNTSAWRSPRPTCGSSGGSPPIDTTIWTRSWARRSRRSGASTRPCLAKRIRPRSSACRPRRPLAS